MFPAGVNGEGMNCADIWKRVIVGSTDHHFSHESRFCIMGMSNFGQICCSIIEGIIA